MCTRRRERSHSKSTKDGAQRRKKPGDGAKGRARKIRPTSVSPEGRRRSPGCTRQLLAHCEPNGLILFLVHRRTFGDPRRLLAGRLARNHTQVRRRLDLGLNRALRRESKFSRPTPKCSSDIRYNDLNWPGSSDPPNKETLDPISLWQLGYPPPRPTNSVRRQVACPAGDLVVEMAIPIGVHPAVPCTANRIWRLRAKSSRSPRRKPR